MPSKQFSYTEYTMESSKRRRSSRLRNLEADHADNDTESIDGQNNNDAKNPPAQAQSIGLRRTRSSSESTLNSTKRRKRTAASKPEPLATSTASVTRRRTRSLSKQLDLKSKRVTPSPVATLGTTKFSFESPTESKDDRGGRNEESDSDDDESSHNTPERVVDLYRVVPLYPFEDHEKETTPVASSAQNKRARTRKAKKQQQLEQWSKRLERPMTFATAGGKVFDSSTPEALTIDFIRKYGDDYWHSLHEREHPIFASSNESDSAESCPSTPSRTKNDSFGSPSSCASSACASTVTPRKSATKPKEFHYYYMEDQNRTPDPHLSGENQKKKLDSQPELTPKMRSILVDWMIELSEHFNFEPSTLHLAVTMVDRVLARGPFGNQEPKVQERTTPEPKNNNVKRQIIDSYSDSEFEDDLCSDEEEQDDDDTRCYLIPRDRFQLLGVTCVWLACKIKETAPPKARQIAYVSDHLYSSGQITRMERRVCNALNFSFLKAPTPHHFLFEFMRASLVGLPADKEDEESDPSFDIPAEAKAVGYAFKSVFRDMCHYLLELGRLPYGPTSQNPSLLAAAAVYLARVTLGIPRALQDVEPELDNITCYWTPTLEHYTGYTQDDLEETVLEIHKYQMAAETSNLKSVFNKYKEKTYNRVALKTVVRREELGFF